MKKFLKEKIVQNIDLCSYELNLQIGNISLFLTIANDWTKVLVVWIWGFPS